MAIRIAFVGTVGVGVWGLAVGVGVLVMAYVGEVGAVGVVDWCGGWSVILLLCVCGVVCVLVCVEKNH